MKKIIFLLSLLVVSMFLVGCSNNEKGVTLSELGSSRLAYSLVNNILFEEDGSLFDEEGLIWNDILEDCAINYGKKSKFNFNGKHSCESFEDNVRNFINGYFYNSNYEFTSEILNKQIVVHVKSENGCPEDQQRFSSGAFPQMINNEMLVTTLYLC